MEVIMAREVQVLTLEKAIQDKYCTGLEEECGEATGLNKRRGLSLQQLHSIGLDGQGVSSVGDEESLIKLCPQVKELHLSSNYITNWTDVCKILHSLSRLQVLNLGYNPLLSSSFQPMCNGKMFDHLSTLVFNSTRIEWQALETCLNAVPLLQDLHLSMNGYTDVSLSESFSHDHLTLLHINDNKIATWEELAKLSSAFPVLQKLIATNNPITSILTLESSLFPELSVLNLNNSALNSWGSIDLLCMLAKLKELSVLEIPLLKDMEKQHRRYAVLARLPKIIKLNKSAVTEEERGTAERWLIREMRDNPDPPAIYRTLVNKHGDLGPLVEVNLNPEYTAMVTFSFDGLERPTVIKKVSLEQTVFDLQKWIAETFLGVPANTVRLHYFYENCLYEKGELLSGKRLLHSYRITDGEEICVRIK